MMVRDLLHRHGYKVVEAHAGDEALAAAERERPDIILMDVQLPRLSGLDAARMIKAHAELRHIPIIAVTSFALDGDERKALAAGCNAYVAKPYRSQQLLQLIQDLLTASRD